ncbi:hypothetical protein [Clostridium thermobutyricum]
MSISLYKRFIEELQEEGVKVERLTLKQVSKSLELYRILGGIN